MIQKKRGIFILRARIFHIIFFFYSFFFLSIHSSTQEECINLTCDESRAGFCPGRELGNEGQQNWMRENCPQLCGLCPVENQCAEENGNVILPQSLIDNGDLLTYCILSDYSILSFTPVCDGYGIGSHSDESIASSFSSMDCMASTEPKADGCWPYDTNGEKCSTFRRCSVDDINFGYNLWDNSSLYIPYEGSRIPTTCTSEFTAVEPEVPECWCDPSDLILKCTGCYEWPSASPSVTPSVPPTVEPTVNPTTFPSKSPSTLPTTSPSKSPSTSCPTFLPSQPPSSTPSNSPSHIPTSFPSCSPTTFPSNIPTVGPTFHPTINPSRNPTSSFPTHTPSLFPSYTPSTDCKGTKIIENDESIIVSLSTSEAVNSQITDQELLNFQTSIERIYNEINSIVHIVEYTIYVNVSAINISESSFNQLIDDINFDSKLACCLERHANKIELYDSNFIFNKSITIGWLSFEFDTAEIIEAQFKTPMYPRKVQTFFGNVELEYHSILPLHDYTVKFYVNNNGTIPPQSEVKANLEQDFGHFYNIEVEQNVEDETLKSEDCVNIFGGETCNDDMPGLDAIYWFILIFISIFALTGVVCCFAFCREEPKESDVNFDSIIEGEEEEEIENKPSEHEFHILTNSELDHTPGNPDNNIHNRNYNDHDPHDEMELTMQQHKTPQEHPHSHSSSQFSNHMRNNSENIHLIHHQPTNENYEYSETHKRVPENYRSASSNQNTNYNLQENNAATYHDDMEHHQMDILASQHTSSGNQIVSSPDKDMYEQDEDISNIQEHEEHEQERHNLL